jgi:hypothetical protein
MPAYANRTAFEDPRSRLLAVGNDLSPARAIVDTRGQVLAHARTGGMLDPQRHVLKSGSTVYRFGGPRSPRDIAKGHWRIDKREFQSLLNFAISHDIHVGLAMHLLFLLPPAWSDATVLVHGCGVQDLLAVRDLGNSVATPMKGRKGGVVTLPHQNQQVRSV